MKIEKGELYYERNVRFTSELRCRNHKEDCR